MKKVSLLLLSACTYFSFPALAQNEIDALRFGQLSSGATALSLGMAGSGGAMGGDFSALSLNPAGIGIYRSSELTFTPALCLNKTNTTYLNKTTADNRSNINVSNFGLVFTNSAKGKEYKYRKWKSFSIGVGYNRLADFYQNVQYSGYNNLSSIAELFSASALYYGVGLNVAPPWGFLGYEGYLLGTDYLSIVPYQDGLIQSKSFETRGGIGEYNLSLGGNYQEKILLGLSVGIQDFSYERYSRYSEDDVSGNKDNNFEYLDYFENYVSRGMGVNVKLGAVYVVNEMLRLGFAFHTTTWSSIKDTSTYSLQSNTENYKSDIGEPNPDPETYVDPQALYQFAYGLRTPWRSIVSATVMLGKYGMINADYEIVGYNKMRYKMRDFPSYADAVNNAIQSSFTLGHVARIGVEGRLNKLMGRVGFAYHSSPFKDATTFGGSRMDMSIGAGMRFGSFFIDAGYMYSFIKVSEYAYPALISGVPTGIADMKSNNNLIALTIGVKI
jgi:long-subunit fatty acid transport protein